jgi:hypothetical protein
MDIGPPERAATEHGRKGRRDSTLLRIAVWGLGAACALTTLVIVAQSPAGGERIKLAMAELGEPTRSAAVVVAAVKPHTDPLVKTLQARLAQLTDDRDRLAARVATLESGFEDLTGSVRKQAAAVPLPAAPAPVPTPVATAEPRGPPPMVVAVAPPLINPLATPPAGVASILPEVPATKEPSKASALDSAAPEAATPGPRAGGSAAPESATTAGVPLPPERVAEGEPAQGAKPAATPARGGAEYGIELATEPTIEALRKRWSGVKANFGPLLVGLSPVAVRDRHPGSTALRLVAGPLPTLIAARKLCVRFAAMNGDCWPARINPADVVQH